MGILRRQLGGPISAGAQQVYPPGHPLAGQPMQNGLQQNMPGSIQPAAQPGDQLGGQIGGNMPQGDVMTPMQGLGADSAMLNTGLAPNTGQLQPMPATPTPGGLAPGAGAAIGSAGIGLAAGLGGNALKNSGQADYQRAANANEIVPGVQRVDVDALKKGATKSAIGGGMSTGASIGGTAGAAIGSVVPVLGTAVGGLIGSGLGAIGGAVGGLFKGKKDGKKAVEDAKAAQQSGLRAHTRQQDAMNAAKYLQQGGSLSASKFVYELKPGKH